MQKAYIDAIYELAEKDSNVVLLTADNGTDYDRWFKEDFSDQYFDMGISECNMVSAAAGLASVGKVPFVQTGGAFLSYRAFEFIRNDVCLQKMNVKIIGTGSGLSISNLGPTHHSTEDIGVLRTIPGLTILSPCSAREVVECVKLAYDIEGPVYIRLGMASPIGLSSIDIPFTPYKCQCVMDGDVAVVFTTGSILEEAVLAANDLLEEGIRIKVVNIHTIKPMNDKEVLEMIGTSKLVISVEEHSTFGGIGSIISEIMAENCCSAKLIRMGLKDCFAKGYGSLSDIRANNGLSAEYIKNTIKNNL
ncbi:MAG: transketolase [Agathobacter sp.]|nr:transketolase [Agathobacter sp.]